MNYNLTARRKGEHDVDKGGKSFWYSLKEIIKLMSGEKRVAIVALLVIICNSALNLAAPLLVAYAVDHYVAKADIRGIFISAGVLLVLYASLLNIFR
jgi:ABC-type multidrug transport system fused ATPase/permease subunit